MSRCAERVAAAGGYQFHQCAADAVEDGLCRKHWHAKQRREHSAARRMAAADAERAMLDARAEVLAAVAYEVEHGEAHDHPNGTIRGCRLCTAWRAYTKALVQP